MRYVNKFDFIVENVAQARSILNRNRITYDNPIYQEILRTTKRDGYTGFITKIIFDLGVDKDDALEIYYKVKKDGTDAGELNKMSKEEVENLLLIEKTEGYEYLFTESRYKVFRVTSYEGILKISSPAWCLKTKSFWDEYTKTKKGMQFVAIQERFAPREDILLTTPSNWDGSRYQSGSYAKMRLGITVYPSGRMDIFDDSNIQLTYNRSTLSDEKYDFIKPILNKISEYHKEHIPTSKLDWDEYDQMKDTIEDIMYELKLRTSFSYMAPIESDMIDDNMNKFFEKIKHETGMNKNEFLKSMNEFRDMILSDDAFISNNGYMDILVNEFLTINGGESLPSVPNITSREHPLGGYFFDEQEIGDSLIKYSYGYQYTKYGRAGIEQGFGSVENFYDIISKDFIDVLLEVQFMSFDIFDSNDIERIDGGQSEFVKRASKTIKREKYKDGYKVTIDIPKLLDVVKELNVGYSKYTSHNRSYGHLTYKSSNELANEIKDRLSPVFKGLEYNKDEQNMIIPICTLK